MSLKMKSGVRISFKPASEIKKTMTPQEYETFKKRIIANLDYPDATEEEKELLISYHLEEDDNWVVEKIMEDHLGKDDLVDSPKIVDKRDGKEQSEIITWDNGMYTGNVDDNLPSGNGTWTSDCGASYDGDWNKGKKHGHGTMVYSDGTKYFGGYINDLRSGIGTLTLPDGSSYTGEWDDNKPQGEGFLTYKSGSTYIGEISYGKRHGLGKLAYPDGRQLEGEWENGKFIRPVMNNSVNKGGNNIFNSSIPKNKKEEQIDRSLFNFKYKRNFIQAIGFYLFFVALRFIVTAIFGFITGSPTTLDYSEYGPWMVVEDLLSATYTIVIYFSVYKSKNMQSVFLIILGLLSGAIAWGFGVLYSFIPIAYLTTFKVNKYRY